ncbi:MAG TPA: extracellular solute-binding protein [Anaerolineales bacterium]|nr:extracellular solute-binding protein [Anaerolineales bacterium]
MFKQIWKYVWLMVVMSMVLAACATASPAAPAVVTQMVAGTPVVVTATPAATQSPYDDNAPITVWIDQPRQPAIDAFLKANPDKASLIKAVVVDREQFPSKVLLFNNTNQGWPDVVFAEPRLVARVADAAHNFPLDLTGWVPADTINNYSAMSNCTFDGKVFCLRNDLAQFVTYYNAPLMTQFGYTVPTTWEDYQALSDKLAKDHPGYYLGTFGDGWTFLSFFEASNCPTHQLVDTSTLNINVADANCTRAASLVDHMIANKTLYNTDFFNTDFDKLITDNKVLMFEGPAWMWGSFGGTKGNWWETASHQLGVAAPFKWAADPAPVVAAMGGAAWTVSRHTKNPKLAVALITFVTEDKTLWTGSENFPAYKPIQPLWQQAVSSNPLFANDPFPIMQAAADEISPLDNWPRFDLISPLTQFAQDTYQKKLTVTANLPEIPTLFTPLAQAQGYDVVTK